jgi:hypothetical protein
MQDTCNYKKVKVHSATIMARPSGCDLANVSSDGCRGIPLAVLQARVDFPAVRSASGKATVFTQTVRFCCPILTKTQNFNASTSIGKLCNIHFTKFRPAVLELLHADRQIKHGEATGSISATFGSERV